MAYRFVGNYSEIDGKTYADFGAAVNITKEQYESAVLGGAAVIPDADFQRIFTGVDPKEMRKYANPAIRTNAPEAFRAKEKEALLVFHNTRLELENPAPKKPEGEKK